MWISFDYVAEENRQMVIKSSGSRYDGMLSELRQDLFGGD
jgi:hypothetical protein